MPAAEHVVEEREVRELVAEQHPDLAGDAVGFFEEGWDTTLWRLGDDLLVRLPRRELAVAGLLAEQRWLPGLAPRLPLPVPVPVRVGVPGCGFPWRWSIVPFLAGTPALAGPQVDGERAARSLGRFLRALHTNAPPDAPHSAWRGVPLSARASTYAELVAELGAAIDGAAVERVWARALDAPRGHQPPTWVHGDLHPGNLLIDGGDLVGVLDFNDLTAGDPATDLSSLWLLFEPEHAEVALEAYGGADEALLARASGWVVLFSLLALSIGRDGREDFAAVGRDGLRRVGAVGRG
jgi:aminoglycoside phosphotransferase (APT) family kinase protein